MKKKKIESKRLKKKNIQESTHLNIKQNIKVKLSYNEYTDE